jgi:hypothetical protein
MGLGLTGAFHPKDQVTIAAGFYFPHVELFYDGKALKLALDD